MGGVRCVVGRMKYGGRGGGECGRGGMDVGGERVRCGWSK